jgi:predicted nucleotidyltransferase
MIKSYNISSENFRNSLLKELLQVLTDFFNTVGSKFYVIGATARDFILSGIHKQVPARKTNDLDIAIAIPDWSMFREISKGLCNIEGFTKSKEQTQRFYYKTYFQLDIVPFGDIAHADNLIYWPPEESQAMSVAGFTDVVKHALEITIDGNLTIYVASLPGIFILKLNAWKSRNIETNRDADDMAYIISAYLDINEQRAVTENYDIYEADDFSSFVAGATLLGRDMKGILRNNPGILNEFAGILKAEVDKKEDSLLINQMLETHQLLEYEKVNDALISITNELNT